MGLPVPTTMEGKIIEECLSSSLLNNQKPEYIEEKMVTRKKAEFFDNNDESELVKKQLKGLGYI